VFVQESTLITITVQQWKIVIPQNLSTASWSNQKPKLIYDFDKNALWAGHQHHGWLLYHCVLAGRAGLTVFMGSNMPTHWFMSKVIHSPYPTTVVKGCLLRSEGWLRDAKNRLFDVSNWRWQWHTLIFILLYILIDIWASQCTPIPSPLIVLMHFLKLVIGFAQYHFHQPTCWLFQQFQVKIQWRWNKGVHLSLHHKLVVPVEVQNTTVD
jgi:hypothetical protein